MKELLNWSTFGEDMDKSWLARCYGSRCTLWTSTCHDSETASVLVAERFASRVCGRASDASTAPVDGVLEQRRRAHRAPETTRRVGT